MDLTRDLEEPICQEKVSNRAQNKCTWNPEGSALISGDTQGEVSLYLLQDSYRHLRKNKV